MRPIRLLAAALLLATPAVHAAVSLSLSANYDSTRTTAYPNGNKPQAGCTPPTGYTEVNLGDGGGEICQQSATEFDFAVLGSNTISNSHIAYKDAGAGDVQIEARVTDSFAGASTTYAGVGIGLRESSASTSWVFQCKSMLNGTNAVQCQYGANGTYTSTDCTASGTTRPVYLGVTYDVSTGDIKGFSSSNGTSWSECSSTNRAMSDVLGYMIGGSKSTTETLSATLDNYALGSTIDAYTPGSPPSGSPPVLTSAIPDQTSVQGTAFSLTFSAYFTGATSYTVSGLPGAGGLSESSDGVISGTPDADDASAAPFSVTLCGVNGDGSTCDVASFTVAAVPGDTFNIASGTGTVNCQTSGIGAGDVIVLAAGNRGPLVVTNCTGTAVSPIIIRNDVTGGGPTVIRKTAEGEGGFVFECDNCKHVEIDGTGKWSGADAGVCGIDETTRAEGRTQCGIKITRTSTSKPTSYLMMTGLSSDFTIRGVEIDGILSNQVGGGVGIQVNDHGEQAADNPGVWRENILIEHNYVHDTGGTTGEGLYLGPNGHQGDIPLRDVEVAYNLIEDTARESMELKYTLDGDSRIHHNNVYRSGLSGTYHENACISVFDGGNTQVDANYMEDCAGTGISANTKNTLAADVDGPLYITILNNIVVRPGLNPIAQRKCINVARAATTFVLLSPALVSNNTCIEPPEQGISFGSNSTGTNAARDNIVAGAGGTPVSGSGTLANNRSGTVASQAFVNAAADDYHLTSSSPARNQGTASAPSTDFDDDARPAESADDQGADEYVP